MSELAPPRPEDLRPPTAPVVATSAPPGWYPDHEVPKRERWWDGREWTALTHRAAKVGGLYSPAYQRSLWTGANRLAGVARGLNLLALLLTLSGLFLLLTPIGSDVTLFILVGTGFALAVAGMVSAIIAFRRSERLGAKALAIYQMVAAPIAMALGFLVLAIGAAV